MKDQFKQYIADGKVEKVIKELLQLTFNLEDQDLHQEVTLQSGRFKEYQKQRREGKEKFELLSQINLALLQIIDELPVEIQTKTSKHKWWEWVIAIGVVAGILGGISEFSGIRVRDLFLGTSTASNSVTVLVHGPEGKDQKILPNRGIVKLIYGDAIVPKQINNQCEATFTQVSDAFFEPDAGVEILFEDPEGEPYRVTKQDSLYRLTRGKHVAIEVKLFGLDKIKGIVKDFETGKPIEGAVIRVQGVEALSNQYGEYSLDIPEDKQLQFQTIRAYHDNYNDFEISDVPTQTKREIPISMKPKK